jgi:hypothetical protein
VAIDETDLESRVERSVELHGLTETAKRLGIGEVSTLRLANGLKVRKTTRALARMHVDRLEDTDDARARMSILRNFGVTDDGGQLAAFERFAIAMRSKA